MICFEHLILAFDKLVTWTGTGKANKIKIREEVLSAMENHSINLSKIQDEKTLEYLSGFKRYSTERIMKSLVGELTQNEKWSIKGRCNAMELGGSHIILIGDSREAKQIYKNVKNARWDYYHLGISRKGYSFFYAQNCRMQKFQFSIRYYKRRNAKEIITMDTYGDNRNIIIDGVPEMEAYIKEVLPDQKAEKWLQEEALEFVPDVSKFFP